MKKLLFLFGLLFLLQTSTYAGDYTVFSQDKNFGLKDKNGTVLIEAEYQKMISVQDTSWLVQKRGRYGLIDSNGMLLVPIKYRHAERVLGKFVKLGNDSDYGIYDANGKIIIPPMYSSIDLLYGNMFLTCRKYKYGIVDFDGNILLANDFDDIYMPTKQTLRILYKGEWYELEKATPEQIEFAANVKKAHLDNIDFTITRLVTDTGMMSGYYAVTATDYVLKIISSISPAYEQTIDDLMLSHGAETVNVVLNPVWLVKFPFVYTRKYVNTLRAPNNGPLSSVKQNIQRKLVN